MAMNDTLSNALSKMSQYEKLGKAECLIQPTSRVIHGVLVLFKQFGYVKDFSMIKEGKKEKIIVKLHGRINECGVIKPRFAITNAEFEKFEKRYLPSKDMGIIIVSTVEGMSDHMKAKEKKIGGRLIAYCY